MLSRLSVGATVPWGSGHYCSSFEEQNILTIGVNCSDQMLITAWASA